MSEEETIQLRIKRENVFNRVYWPLYRNDTPLQIVYGGASSGKSVDTAQEYVLDLLTQPGRNVLAVRDVANTLPQSCYAEMEKAINRFKVGFAFDCVSSPVPLITCTLNQNQMFFRGMDNPQKLKSITPAKGTITDIWVEEATEIGQAAFNDLLFRLRGRAPYPKRVKLTFNPIYRQHWIAQTFFNGIQPELGKITYLNSGKVLVLRVNYTHNLQHLDPGDIERIEGYNDPSDKNKEYWWKVYGLGEWGVLGGVIFTNWRAADLSELTFTSEESDFGLDFGYSPDPAAFVQSINRGEQIYIPRGLYQTGLTNPQLAEELYPMCGEEIVWCDSAEPKSIRELRTDPHYTINARGVRKGPDSIRAGIKWLQRHEIIVDSSLQWLINELAIYAWAKDKLGQMLHPPKPIDAFNHGIDALRYSKERRIRRAGGLGAGSSSEEERSKLKEMMEKKDETTQILNSVMK